MRKVAMRVMLAAACSGANAHAQDNPVILQWFETRWSDMERRIPDFFVAGYGAVWLPPPSKGGIAPTGNTDTVGYDPWERFDLGSPGRQTAYGTEQGFRALVAEFHRANALVYIDAVLNHNGSRQTSASFQSAGGYPGFWMAPSNPPVNKLPTSPWGDFQAGTSSGYYQSENPSGPRYDRERGDLVGLIDIDQGTNHQFIRHPINSTNPQNIPPGSTWNLPDPANARFYPDRQLTPMIVTNPGTFRNPGATQTTIYPFNTSNPMAGDPVAENATGLLVRWVQWMLDEFRVDGFRIDAIKHVPTWFWDRYFDTAVYQRRVTADGRRVTPFSFGESVEGNQFTYDNYIRKSNNIPRAGDGFGNRDALDLSGAGALRDLLNAAGLGSWQNVAWAHLDTIDDGNDYTQDGSLGVNHVFSHDNGSAGNGTSPPPIPTIRQQFPTGQAYVLMRTGATKIYHNPRGIARSGGFWPRSGVDLALGLDYTPLLTGQAPVPGDLITRLVRIRNRYARGQFYRLNFTEPNPGLRGLEDVLIFDRREGGQSNVLAAFNDRYDAGYDARTVFTQFPPGTILVELTGNASSPQVDPADDIRDILVVGADGRVDLRVPRNRTGSIEHNRGYVIYGPAVPAGTPAITPVSGEIPADTPSTNPSANVRVRLNPIPIVQTSTFTIDLATTPALNNFVYRSVSYTDINTDDHAAFRINQGYRDFNGNGAVDYPHTAGVLAGYENFLTINQPAYNGATATTGRYAQIIDASMLEEGVNYISVIAFRRRPSGTSPLFAEWRLPVYVDRLPPQVAWANATDRITTDQFRVDVRALDRTVRRVHVMLDVPPGVDPRTRVDLFNLARVEDRLDYYLTLVGLRHGHSTITLVAFEESDTLMRSNAVNYPVFIDLCPADLDDDGVVDFNDFLVYLNWYNAGDPRADLNGDGVIDFNDLLEYLNQYNTPCA
jgi:glycosidase